MIELPHETIKRYLAQKWTPPTEWIVDNRYRKEFTQSINREEMVDFFRLYGPLRELKIDWWEDGILPIVENPQQCFRGHYCVIPGLLDEQKRFRITDANYVMVEPATEFLVDRLSYPNRMIEFQVVWFLDGTRPGWSRRLWKRIE